MTRILIPTHPGDAHAVAVSLALESRGHEAVEWLGSDFPTLQSASIEIRGGEIDWEIAGPEIAAGPVFDVVWLRRKTPALLPASLHPGDLPVARRDAGIFWTASTIWPRPKPSG